MEFGLRHAHDVYTQVFVQMVAAREPARKLVADLLASWIAFTDGAVASHSIKYPNYQSAPQSSVWPHAVNRGRRWRRQVVCLSVCP